MKSFGRQLAFGFCILLLHQQSVYSQDLDFSDLDKVEQDEFGGDTPGNDTGDFDLETNAKPDPNATSEIDDLDKEMENLEGKPATPGNNTVDLDQELPEEPMQKQAAEPTPAPAPEMAPPLKTPEEPEEKLVEEPVTAPEPEQLAEEPRIEPPPPAEEKVALQPAPQIDDEPNSKLEARLNRIYEKFMKEKTTDEEWLQKVQGAGENISESYQVQSGDTLWDISITFFGSGYFWPKIWQLNDEITNPHIIRPGKVLRFIPGTMEQAPRLRVTDVEGTDAEPTQVLADAVEAPEPLEDEGPQIPPAEKKRAALKKLPPSLPYIKFDDDGAFDSEGFSIEKQKSNIQAAAIPLTGYLSEKEPVSVGEVVGVEQMGASTAATHQYVYVKLQDARVGETLTAFGVGKRAEFVHTDAYPVDYQGKIQIIESASDTEPLFKALVTYSIGQVMIGSKLSRESIPRVTLKKDGKENSTVGVVIGGALDAKRTLMSDSSVIYLNIGANNGVSVGDVMTVVRNDKARNSKSRVTRNSKKIAAIKIAKVTDTLATAVVIQSTDEVMPGDNVGGVEISSNGASKESEVILYDPGDGSSTESDLDQELKELE